MEFPIVYNIVWTNKVWANDALVKLHFGQIGFLSSIVAPNLIIEHLTLPKVVVKDDFVKYKCLIF